MKNLGAPKPLEKIKKVTPFPARSSSYYTYKIYDCKDFGHYMSKQDMKKIENKKKIIIIKIEDKIYTAAITTSEKGTLISFI